jgi:hypothetical protein
MGVMKRMATDRMLDIRVAAKVTKYFFDRRAVIDRIGRAKAAVLSKAGAYIRRAAKGKIRYAKSPSKPGNPPHAHQSQKGGKDSPLRELIYFAYDDRTNSVVIGPMPFHGTPIVPRVLELGGTAPGHKNPLRRIRRVGNGGEIRLDGPAGRTTKKNRFGAMVTYTKLQTQAQVDRANRLQEVLYGPLEIGPVSIAARPYMGPALQENLPQLPALWAHSVT